MNRYELRLLLYTTVAAFAALYAPQPILPRLAADFGVSPSDASLLISATMIPLGLAPVIYGYLIEAVPARLVLLWAIALLIAGQLLFALTDHYGVLLAARLLQGLAFPATFTAIMTYCSTSATRESVRRVIGYYVAATILGGFGGRLLSGVIASAFSWRETFLLLALMLSLSFVLILRLPGGKRIDFARLDRRAISRVLGHAPARYGLLVIFCVFFTFASLLNALPFNLRENDAGISDFVISLVYAGYIVGVVVALQVARISRLLGGDLRVIQTGLVLFAAGTALFALPGTVTAITVMFVFVTGMFMVHSTLSGFLNHIAAEHKGVVNGLYISFYYSGGAIGSWLPTLVYSRFGWQLFICVLLGVCALAGYFAYRLSVALRDA
ncbi:MFS transporter [Granulosicoccaceae sp. 1_MG-2023]|nr:MFS transporter [Granulosicoccaceae sp. 1_MG-2023]